ncbi:MAG: RNA-binding domain-containing protein [Candidatus Poseidoniaceae archaeon]
MADDRFSVRAHVSAMDHADVVQQAMEAWLGEVEVERSAYASHAGPTMLTLSVDLRRKSDLRKAWAGIDEAALNTLLVEVNDRLDDEGGLHFRIDLDGLVAGRVVLAPPGAPRSVKVRCKVAVYPGQTAEERLGAMISAALA